MANNSIFQLRVNVTNVEYLSTGQFDVFYNRTMVGVRSPNAIGGSVNDTLDRSMYCYDDGEEVFCDPATGCGWKSIAGFSSNGIDIGYGNAPYNSGCLRILWETEWAQKQTFGGCQGGSGSGPTGDGWIALITFKAISPGTSEIGFWKGDRQKHPNIVAQVVDWALYEDYAYSGGNVIWGPNVLVTVQ